MKLFGTRLDFKFLDYCSKGVPQVESDRQSSHLKSTHTNTGIAQESRIDALPHQTTKPRLCNFQVNKLTRLLHLGNPSAEPSRPHHRPTVHRIIVHRQPECRDVVVKYTSTGIRSWALDWPEPADVLALHWLIVWRVGWYKRSAWVEWIYHAEWLIRLSLSVGWFNKFHRLVLFLVVCSFAWLGFLWWKWSWKSLHNTIAGESYG